MYRPVARWENAFVVENNENRCGYRAQVVPGFIRGMDKLFQRFGSGRLTWRDLIQPAIDRAQQGFAVHPHLYAAWQPGQTYTPLGGDPYIALSYSAESRRLYLKEDGSVYRIGEILVQQDLAHTLTEIADGGADEFYFGSIARRIADDFANSGGLLNMADLESFTAEESAPVSGSYRNLTLVTENAPSVGPTLLEILNILELADLSSMGWNSPEYLDYLTQVLYVAFRDRDERVGDPTTGDLDIDTLMSKAHAAEVREQILSGAVRTQMCAPAPAAISVPVEHDTTHMTTLDEDGNACGITHSVGMGTGVVTPGLGFMHNCHMTNFDPRPGRPNSIAPGKRGTGGGAPVFAFKGGRVVLSMGSPAGNFKASAMAQTLVNLIDFGRSLADAVSVDRIHVRCEPPLVIIDHRFAPRAALDLAARGYAIEMSDYSARVVAVSKDLAETGFDAASDIRGDRGRELVELAD
jgi:gamma-glutamyltranspeptidase/glutathione hydrolase